MNATMSPPTTTTTKGHTPPLTTALAERCMLTQSYICSFRYFPCAGFVMIMVPVGQADDSLVDAAGTAAFRLGRASDGRGVDR